MADWGESLNEIVLAEDAMALPVQEVWLYARDCMLLASFDTSDPREAVLAAVDDMEKAIDAFRQVIRLADIRHQHMLRQEQLASKVFDQDAIK